MELIDRNNFTHEVRTSKAGSLVRAQIESGGDLIIEAYREYPLMRADFINYSLTGHREDRITVDFLASWAFACLVEGCEDPFFHAHAVYEIGYHRLRKICFYEDLYRQVDSCNQAFVHADHLYDLWQQTNPSFLQADKVVCVQHNKPLQEPQVTTELTPLVASVLGRLSVELRQSPDKVIQSGGNALDYFLDSFAR